MNLDETFNLSGKVTANLLTSEQGTDANSFNDPNKVIDKTYNLESIISNESPNTMNIDLEPCSLTIFRIQLK